MTERASELLSELADRLSADSRDSGQVVAESVRTLEPELLRMQKDGASIDDLVRTSVGFLEILFRSLRADSRVPWQQYYTLAREASRRYAEKGIPLESVMEGLAVFRRSVIARVMEEMAGNEYADEVLLLAQSRLGDVVEHLNSSFIRGYLDYTEARHRASQSELHGLYQIASALGRSLDRAEIAMLVRPCVPDRHPMLVEIFDVGVAGEKPEQLVNDRFDVQLLGGGERKALGEVEAHLVPEHRQGAGAGAIMLLDAVGENPLHQLVILTHATSGHCRDSPGASLARGRARCEPRRRLLPRR